MLYHTIVHTLHITQICSKGIIDPQVMHDILTAFACNLHYLWSEN